MMYLYNTTYFWHGGCYINQYKTCLKNNFNKSLKSDTQKLTEKCLRKSLILCTNKLIISNKAPRLVQTSAKIL